MAENLSDALPLEMGCRMASNREGEAGRSSLSGNPKGKLAPDYDCCHQNCSEPCIQ